MTSCGSAKRCNNYKNWRVIVLLVKNINQGAHKKNCIAKTCSWWVKESINAEVQRVKRVSSSFNFNKCRSLIIYRMKFTLDVCNNPRKFTHAKQSKPICLQMNLSSLTHNSSVIFIKYFKLEYLCCTWTLIKLSAHCLCLNWKEKSCFSIKPVEKLTLKVVKQFKSLTKAIDHHIIQLKNITFGLLLAWGKSKGNYFIKN